MSDLQSFIRDAELSIIDMRQLDTPDGGEFAGHPAWLVTIVKRGNQSPMHVTFHMGQGDTRAPSLAQLLDDAASNAVDYRNARDFRGWCDTVGLDADDDETAAHHAAYLATGDQVRDLSNLLLDPELEDRLLYATDRL